ncbi:MAG: RNA polymerase sigma factor [Candidatus Cryptobacteroides sp.]
MTESAEQKLIERICNRDGTAMKALYDEYAGLLAAVCSRYIDADEDVKDILQESFIRIFSSIGSFRYRGQGSLRAWMTKIVVNTSLKHLRDSAKMGFLSFADSLPEVEDEGDMSLEGIPAEAVQEMIRSLPVGYRTVFNLFVFEGKSHREIAEILGIKENSASSQLHRARAMLERKVREYRDSH